MKTPTKKERSITLSGTIHCLSGLRIGGSNELLQVGAEDNSVIKDPNTELPYIPGSSLRGRLRSEMESMCGKYTAVERFDKHSRKSVLVGQGPYKGHMNPEEFCPICTMFGPHSKTEHKFGPSRLICRDAPLLDAGKVTYDIKTENSIYRDTHAATNPRKLELVPAGTKFRMKLVVQVWDVDHEQFVLDREQFNVSDKLHKGVPAMFEFLRVALTKVQEEGIGAATRRGCGEIEFLDLVCSDTTIDFPTNIRSV